MPGGACGLIVIVLLQVRSYS